MSNELKTLTNSDQEIGSNLGEKPIERNYTQENHYKRLDQELDSFASGLREVQTKIPNIESKLENINTLIENKVIKEIESKKLATKEELKGQIDEIKSNKKMYLGLVVGAVLGFLANTGLIFVKQKFETPTNNSPNPQKIMQPATKTTK